MIKEINNPIDNIELLNNYKKILFLMIPVIPHFASECLEDLKILDEKKWPIADKKFLLKEKNEIVIQINGKKRSIIECEKSINEENLIELVKKDKKIQKFIENHEIIRSIYIKDKLINLIIK